MRIGCGRSSGRPHKSTFRLVLKGRGARAEAGTFPSCRPDARVRRRSSPSSSDRYLEGSEPAYLAARSTHFSSCAAATSPFDSTKTQAFIGRPVRTNTRVCGSAMARPASSGPRRTIRASRCTPPASHQMPSGLLPGRRRCQSVRLTKGGSAASFRLNARASYSTGLGYGSRPTESSRARRDAAESDARIAPLTP
jgi:hypothetical protein